MKKSNIKSYAYFFQLSYNKVDRKWQTQTLSATHNHTREIFSLRARRYLEFIDIIFCRSSIHVKLCMILENAFWQFDSEKFYVFFILTPHRIPKSGPTSFLGILCERKEKKPGHWKYWCCRKEETITGKLFLQQNCSIQELVVTNTRSYIYCIRPSSIVRPAFVVFPNFPLVLKGSKMLVLWNTLYKEFDSISHAKVILNVKGL